MDVLQMQAIVAIVDTGSFSKAAEAMGVSTPTIKNQVDALEFEIGAPLFTRTKQGSTPTLRGSYIAEKSRAVLATIDDIVDGARALESLQGVLLVIPRIRSQEYYDMICAGFIEAHPQISLRFVMHDDYATTLDLLADGRANAAFWFSDLGNSSESEGFLAVPCPGVPPVTYRLVLSSGHELPMMDSIAKNDILELRRSGIRIAMGCGVPRQLEPYVGDAVRLDDPYAVVNHCLDGGACLTDSYTAVNDGRLVELPIADAREVVHVCARADHSYAVEEFVRYCASWTWNKTGQRSKMNAAPVLFQTHTPPS